MSNTLENFMANVDNAIHDALQAGAEPDDIEMILQLRAQDMREEAAAEDVCE